MDKIKSNSYARSACERNNEWKCWVCGYKEQANSLGWYDVTPQCPKCWSHDTLVEILPKERKN